MVQTVLDCFRNLFPEPYQTAILAAHDAAELGIAELAALTLLHSSVHNISPCLIRPDAITAPVSPAISIASLSIVS
jgi:hypothetical protein